MTISCFAYPNPIFAPAMRIILSISQSNPAIVTTSYNGLTSGAHGYPDGTIVRLDIPAADGMPQANGFVGPVTVTSTTTFTLPLDTTMFTPFAIPNVSDPHIVVCAQVVPIGELNGTLAAAVQNVLPAQGLSGEQ